jgi:hypothetical protein
MTLQPFRELEESPSASPPDPILEPPTIEQARDRWLNHAGFATGAIESLTGNDVDTDMFWCTRNETTRDKLENALANNKIVVAGTYVSWFAPQADYAAIPYSQNIIMLWWPIIAKQIRSRFVILKELSRTDGGTVRIYSPAIDYFYPAVCWYPL